MPVLLSIFILQMYMLNTNRLTYDEEKEESRSRLVTSSPKVNDVIKKFDDALLNYEIALSIVSRAGIDVPSMGIDYKWTYVSSVFFTSTVITTVGEFYYICTHTHTQNVGNLHINFPKNILKLW